MTRRDDWAGPVPMPNELTALRLGEIYSGTAAFYDTVVADKQAAAKLTAIEVLARRHGERFLEVGVGTAWAFQRVIASSGREGSLGLDVARGMLEVAKDVLAESGVNAPPLLLGDGRHLPLPDGSMDCILNTYTFEVMSTPDIAAMLDETLRVLRPGGRLVVVNLTDATNGEEGDAAMIAKWKAGFAADPEFFGGARPLQLSEMITAHGFKISSRRYVGRDWPSEVLLGIRPA